MTRSSFHRRRPASYFRRCIRTWFRHEGRIVRMLSYTDYSACAAGGEPRQFFKLLDHARYAKGMKCSDSESSWLASEVIPHMQPGKWIELVWAEPAKEF